MQYLNTLEPQTTNEKANFSEEFNGFSLWIGGQRVFLLSLPVSPLMPGQVLRR